MKKVSGVFLGSGAARWIGLGFLPDWVQIRNVAAAALPKLVWDRGMTVHSRAPEGLVSIKDDETLLTRGTGVQLYYGGDKVAAEAVTHLVGVNEHADYQGDQRGKGVSGNINRFFLDHSGNATGHFDAAAHTTYVNAGSRILIGGRLYAIQAIANSGTAANEVTLDRAAPTGEVTWIGYRADYGPAPVGLVMPAGIYLAEIAAVNANGELCVIEAGNYDS